jgi:hypothetical protein
MKKALLILTPRFFARLVIFLFILGFGSLVIIGFPSLSNAYVLALGYPLFTFALFVSGVTEKEPA